MSASINSPTPPGFLSRREFVRLCALSTAGMLAGCATNPVTGKTQLMLVSEDTEIQIDRKHSPHQFSADYGLSQDVGLNRYINQVGIEMAKRTHRAHMPYSFQCVNANYINAYAFPGGSIATTRGILLSLQNEAQLAALLGHELGHVNARHTAEQMSQGMLVQAVVVGLSAYAATRGPGYGQLASQLGMLGAGALLASYSRDNEREADRLGMDYMLKGGYGIDGYVGLMAMLNGLNKKRPSGVSLLFSTHPMSQERYDTAVRRAQADTLGQSNPLQRERYMDHTARLRTKEKAILTLRAGEKLMAANKFGEANASMQKALKLAPNDYTALVLMAKCQLAQKKNAQALRYSEKAKRVYPSEVQAWHLSGVSKLRLKRFGQALADFQASDQKLPGNPNTSFFEGYANEGMKRKEPAAGHYSRFLRQVNQGDMAKHAYKRLVEWGYIKQPEKKS